MATSPTVNNNITVQDFLTSLRSQYLPTNVQGTPTVNFGNIVKDTFNNGVVGVGYGLAENLVSKTVPNHYSLTTGAQINFNPSNVQAAKVIRGLGQALGCVIDLGDAVGNVSTGNNNAAICNIASCIGGVGGGWAGGTLLAPGGPIFAFGGATVGGYAGGKSAEYLCKKYFDIPTNEDDTPASNPYSTAGSAIPATGAPRTGSLAAMASNIVKFRASPDYAGEDGTYSAQKGQTLTKIAKENGITLDELLASNPQIVNPNDIRAGQLIRLPDTAIGYSNGTGTTASLTPTGIPENNAQIDALTQVLGGVSGEINIITENSGRITVVDVNSGTAIIIGQDGTIAAQSFESYWSQAELAAQQIEATGINLSQEPMVFIDFENESGLLLDNGEQGVLFDRTGALVVDPSGNTLLLGGDENFDIGFATNAQTGNIQYWAQRDEFFDGSTEVTTTYPSGRIEVATTDSNNQPAGLTVTTPTGPNTEKTDTFGFDANGKQVLRSSKTVEYFDDPDGRSHIDTVTTYVDGVATTVRNTYDADNNLFKTETLPTPVSSLTNEQSIAALNNLASLITAIQSGKPLPILTSGVQLLNTLTTGSVPSIVTANSVLSGLSSLYNLHNTLAHSGNTLGKINATLSTLNYVNTSLPQLISGPGTAAFSPALNGFLNGTGTGAQGAFAGLGAGNVPGVLPVQGLIISIKNGDPIGTVSGNQRSPDPLGFQSYYTFDSCSRIFHGGYGHKTYLKEAANDAGWRMAA